MRERVYDTAAILLAAGLDPERCVFFRQGDVARAHRAGLAARRASPRSATSTACTSSRRSRPASATSSRAGLFFYPVLRPPTCWPTAPTRCRWATTSASTSSSCATSPSASTPASARCSSSPSCDPERRRADHGPAGPDVEDVDDRRHAERARSTCSTRPKAVEKKFKRAVTDSGRRDRPRARQARGLEPDRHPRRGARHATPEAIERGRSPAPATATSRRATADAVVEYCWTRCASATTSCAPTRTRSRRSSPRAPRRRAAHRVLADVRADVRREAHGPSDRRCSARALTVGRPLRSGRMRTAGRRARARPGGLHRARSTSC